MDRTSLFPLRLHCDNVQEFRSNEIRELLNIKWTFITPYRPKGNGLWEHTNGTIETILKCMIQQQWHEWDIALPYALMAYRLTPHSSTSLSQNMMVYSRESTMPCDIVNGNMTNKQQESYSCYCSYVDDLRTKMVTSYEIASNWLKTSALRQKRIYDSNTVPRQFLEGDWVLFYHKRLASQTLMSGWNGQHLIVSKVGDSTYRIQTKSGGPTKVMNVDNLMIHGKREPVPNWITDKQKSSLGCPLIHNDKQVDSDMSSPKQSCTTQKPTFQRSKQSLCVPTAQPVRQSSRLASRKAAKYVCLYFNIPAGTSLMWKYSHTMYWRGNLCLMHH
jgi:hypothetical protein